MDETVGAILLTDLQGSKLKTGLKRFLSGSTPANVIRGELLLKYEESSSFNYMLNRDTNICLLCDDTDIAPLNREEFLLLEAINLACDRLVAFQNKLEFGVNVKQGTAVHVTIPGVNLSVEEHVRATVHSKGNIGNQPGINFGVEILNRGAAGIGTTDGTFQGKRYFRCLDGCGLFVPLHLISPADSEQWETNPSYSSALSREKNGDRSQKPDYSRARSKEDGTAPTQNPSYSNAVSKEHSKAPAQKPSSSSSLSRDDRKALFSCGDGSRVPSQRGDSSVDPPPSVHVLGDRVMFHDKLGKKYYGKVRWTGREHKPKIFPYWIVGIQTEEQIFMTEFEGSVTGMGLLTKSIPNRHALFLPEGLVDKVPSQRGGVATLDSTQSLAKEFNVSPENVTEQREAMELAEKNKIAKDDKTTIDAMVAADQSVNITEQQNALLRYEADKLRAENIDQRSLKNTAVTKQEFEQRESESKRDDFESGQGGASRMSVQRYHTHENMGSHHSPSIQRQKDTYSQDSRVSPVSHHRESRQQKYPSEETSADYENFQPQAGHRQEQPGHRQEQLGRPHDQEYMHADHRQEHPGHRQEKPWRPLDQEYLHSDHRQEQPGRPREHEHLREDPRLQQPGRPHDQEYLHADHRQEQPGRPREHEHLHADHRQEQPGRPREQEHLHADHRQEQPGRPHEHSRAGNPDPYAERGSAGNQFLRTELSNDDTVQSGDAVANTVQDGFANGVQNIRADTGTPGDRASNLSKGSLIQIPSPDLRNPLRYGTIKWIGVLPNVKGLIAGIELDEVMEGCSDGTYPQTKQKFFSCEYGKGLYYPLERLQPDEKYAPEVAVDGNPLKHVSEEEFTAPASVAVDQYIGDEKGIQGHQNSCYLDATLFGLFALTHEFDPMFLQNADTPIGNTLWKNIVNPLRKNGVVKFECVMKLREQLDQLGKMKGITQDEKDPEEFLNMMFKHTLQVKPFISIRRPFGVEEEYFVQLFLEMDDTQKLPSIGDLVDKMFSEQNISFTEVPSKLLIQVPRFGKKFQMFQKIIPAKCLSVAKNVDLRNPLICYICGSVARKICHGCTEKYVKGVSAFCDTCLETVHKNKDSKNHNWEWSKEMQEIMTIAELDLLCVICIETSHYVCFTRQENRWIFSDSMANRVYDKYNIPKVVDCTDLLNDWVYPPSGNLTRLLNTPPRELPEYVRRFTQDIYMCVYIQPDLAMYA